MQRLKWGPETTLLNLRSLNEWLSSLKRGLNLLRAVFFFREAQVRQIRYYARPAVGDLITSKLGQVFVFPVCRRLA